MTKENLEKSILLFEYAYQKLLKNLNLNAHISINNKKNLLNELKNSKNNLLKHKTYALKDNIATKNLKTTAGSKILSNFFPNYDATVFKKLEEASAILLCKANLDELGMAGTGTYSYNERVINPWNKNIITGGSSSGSCALVAKGIVDFSIGTDTGDSIRKPASYCGVYGFKPTWGVVSRYGLFDFCPSFDAIGVIANDVETISNVMNVISGYDEKDPTTLLVQDKKFIWDLKKISLMKLKVGIFTSLFNEIASYPANEVLLFAINVCKFLGWEIVKIDFNSIFLKSCSSIYSIIAFSEASSCFANLNGLVFGKSESGSGWEEKINNSRTKNLGKMVKRRFVIGSFALEGDNYELFFNKAKKIRRLICKEMEDTFLKCDFILSPTTLDVAPSFSDLNNIEKTELSYDITSSILLLGNFYGCCSISIPTQLLDNCPMGITITCNRFDDSKCIKIAELLSKRINFQNTLLDKNEK
ncbi:Asp-tRNA(Asn)/Glu-tRNA(Gln) amidotransferase subunit GatA [symbiont of Argiope bruennichi]|uniref:amidase family protein n=1 Tax=symbiont of Argiope bruennichi TaxID=2810479 RepID=UPI003DA366A0